MSLRRVRKKEDLTLSPTLNTIFYFFWKPSAQHSKSSSEISNKFKRKRMTTGKSYIHFTSLFLIRPGYLKRCQMSHGCWWQEATGEEA